MKRVLKKYGKRIALSIVLFLTLTASIVGYAEWRVVSSAKGKWYEDEKEVPETDVALLLGTAKYFQGRINLFYSARIQAAARLFHAGKVRAILASGDNSTMEYNEPRDIKQDLIESGVPAEFITLDYAGFRTLDSVVRAQKVFGQKKVVIVSQRFHLERAIYLAQETGMEAIGYVAQDPAFLWWLKIRIRESFARIMVVLDVAFGRSPKYLGKKERIILREK